MAEEVITESVAPAQPGKGNKLVVTLIAVGVLVAVFAIVWLQSSKYEPPKVGKTAPEFALTDLED